MLPDLETPQDAAQPGDQAEDLAPPNPMVTIPLSPDDLSRWKGEIDRAKKRVEQFAPGWERNLKNYAPDLTDTTWGDEINPGVDFSRVEQKKAQLFFATPTVVLTPEPDVQDPQVKQQITDHGVKLNRKIGRKGLDYKRLMDKVLFDILCPAGEGTVKFGVTRIERPAPDPTNPGATVSVPLYTKIFAERVSPKQVLKPTNFYDTEFDKAPWLGTRFRIATRVAKRLYHLPDDFAPRTSQASDQVFNLPGLKTDTDPEEMITGVEIFYYAWLYDDAIDHPDWMRQLVFVDGLDDPVVHRDSPYQTYDPQTNSFTPDSMIGNPIDITTVRDMADSAWIPSDCTIRRPLVNELAKFRTQLIQHRDASTPIRVGTERIFNNETVPKVVRGPWGSLLTVPDADYDPARPPAMMITQPAYGRENFQSQTIIERDLDGVDAMSANQVGAETQTERSATEATYIARNSNVRLQAEKDRVEAAFLRHVGKIDALLKRYETPQGQQPLDGYSYDVKPDSGVFVDAAAERKFALDRYNYLRKDPMANAGYLLEQSAPLLHLDAAQLIKQPPPPGPPPPKTSFIVKGEDLNPLAPQYSNVVEFLSKEGVQLTVTPVTPQMIENAAQIKAAKQPPPHPGTAPKADTLSKHGADITGKGTANFGGQAEAVQ